MEEISELLNKWITIGYITLGDFIGLLVGVDPELGVYVGVDDDEEKANIEQDAYDKNLGEIRALFNLYKAGAP